MAALTELLQSFDAEREGAELYQLVSDLYPICRSITGNGLRESLRLIQRTAPLSLHEVPSGTPVFDWVVPNEWNIRDAWIKNNRGEKVVDFHRSNLHVISYSTPVRQSMSLAELRPHLITLPDTPDWIPYRTSYYQETWGFCLNYRQYERLRDETYEVCIDSTLGPGHLTYGELRIPGGTDAEVLISAHSCHPSLANDNLSGMAVAAVLAQHLSGMSLRYSYRFLWIPGTIGAITWLALHEAELHKIKHGLVLSCLGDPGRFTYKRSRRGNAEIDRVAAHILAHSAREFHLLEFTPLGYDERQYCSPGINLPMGCLMRTPNGVYPQYHTSADDLSLVNSRSLAESLNTILHIIRFLEGNQRYVNLKPKCEPQLGQRGLYRQLGGTKNATAEEAMLWVLNLSDGEQSLLDIAIRSGLLFATLRAAAENLLEAGLLDEADRRRQ